VGVVDAAVDDALVPITAAQEGRLEHQRGMGLEPPARYFSGSRSNFCLQPTAQK
jgi:hypothetical protein